MSSNFVMHTRFNDVNLATRTGIEVPDYKERQKQTFTNSLTPAEKLEYDNFKKVYFAVSEDTELFYKTLKITRKLPDIESARRLTAKYLPYL